MQASLRRARGPSALFGAKPNVGEVCCDSCSVKTSAALGLADLLPLSRLFLVLLQSEEAGAVALAGVV
jgi:hypothetical protein